MEVPGGLIDAETGRYIENEHPDMGGVPDVREHRRLG
jgi:hypothetical protein